MAGHLKRNKERKATPIPVAVKKPKKASKKKSFKPLFKRKSE